MSLSSSVWKPLSPSPTKVITRPTAAMPRPTYRMTLALPPASNSPLALGRSPPSTPLRKKTKNEKIYFEVVKSYSKKFNLLKMTILNFLIYKTSMSVNYSWRCVAILL
jgi:hypothetical protein